MAQLLRAQKIIIPNLEVATHFWERGRGLLGRRELPNDRALWIHRCNSIHTWFMKFAIDCVFVDRAMRVRAIRANVVPWRVVFPVWGASSVIEMASGQAAALGIKEGEVLNVGA